MSDVNKMANEVFVDAATFGAMLGTLGSVVELVKNDIDSSGRVSSTTVTLVNKYADEYHKFLEKIGI